MTVSALPARRYTGRQGAMRARSCYQFLCLPSSILRLPPSLLDLHVDRERLIASAVAGAACGRGAELIETDRDAHMGVGGADPVRSVEGDPAEPPDEGLGPGVAGVCARRSVRPMDIAGNIARRDADAAGGRDEYMGQVGADAALLRKR